MRILFKIAIVLLTFAMIISCNGNTSYEDEDEFSEYEDGTYCADVTYYNPNTGTRNTYDLEVEVENYELVKIYWNNGGWLDEDHFSPEQIDENGYCSFSSDKGNDYEIQITGINCGRTQESLLKMDMENDERAITCPECGDKKGIYDDYCYYCERKIEDEEENTCSRCGDLAYGVYGGLCNNCKQNDEEDEEDEEY